MTPARRAVVACLVAVAVPSAAFTLAPPLEGHDPAFLAPFGWPEVAVVHLAATLPLAFVLARGLPPAPVVAGGVGLALALATLGAGAAVGPWLDRAGAGPIARGLVRAAWCLALQAPWVAALAPRGGEPATPWPRRVALCALSLAAALAPPAVFTLARARAAAAEAAELLGEARLARALGALDALHAAGAAPPADRRRLREELRRYRALVDRPLPAGVPPAALLDRAELLYRLDRLDDAAAQLEALGAGPPAARMLLGTVRRHQGRFAESERAYRGALADLAGDDTPAGQARRASLYDNLAFLARERRRHAEAERLYHEALGALPGHRAHFHLQLARHHHQAGRPAAARRQLDECERHSPGLDDARRLREEIEQATPGCLLPRPGRRLDTAP